MKTIGNKIKELRYSKVTERYRRETWDYQPGSEQMGERQLPSGDDDVTGYRGAVRNSD